MAVAAPSVTSTEPMEVMASTAQISLDASHSGTTDLRAVCLRSLAEMDAWASAWRELDASSSAPHRYFQSHDWCHNWLVNHGNAKLSPLVVLLLRGTRLVAVLPLMRVRCFAALSVLRSLGEPHTQYGNVLTRNGVLTCDEITAMQVVLFRESGADSIIVNYVPDGSPLTQILGASTRASELHNRAAQFDLQEFKSPQDYRSSLSKSRRRARRKAEAALSEFGEVRLEILRPGDTGHAAAVAHCVALKKNWIKHTGRIGAGLDYEGHARFLSALPATATREGGIVFVLKAGPIAVASEVGFLQDGHYYSYLGSFMWSLRHASPGTLQIELALEWLMDNGARTFDFLGNPMQYKAQWSNREVALSCHIHNLTRAGRLYTSLWVRRIRPRLKTLYHHLPAPARRSFAIFREIDFSQLKSA